MKKVNVLGSEWDIEFKKLGDKGGICDHSIKKIYVDNSKGNVEDNLRCQQMLLRHELVHAFLFESGLAFNAKWTDNEEMVDWIALQLPKMAEACKETGCME